MERSMPQPRPTSLAPVYTACLYGQRGFLAVIDRALTFLEAGGDTCVVTPDDVNFLTCGSLVAEPEASRRRDQMRGQHDYLRVTQGG